MKLELKDMQISKVEVLKKSESEVGLRIDENILNPTSFALIIKRNLSSGWYKEIPELDISGRLKSIVVSWEENILYDSSLFKFVRTTDNNFLFYWISNR